MYIYIYIYIYRYIIYVYIYIYIHSVCGIEGAPAQAHATHPFIHAEKILFCGNQKTARASPRSTHTTSTWAHLCKHQLCLRATL